MVKIRQFLNEFYKTATGILLLFLLAYASCDHTSSEAHPTFYYWKPDFKLRSNELSALTRFDTKDLYIRYFDVIKNTDGRGKPEAVVRFDSVSMSGLNPKPVVYIVNQVLKGYTADNISELSERIVRLVAQINQSIEKKTTELQIDCDWTESTKMVYFELLKSIKEKIGNDITLSATIRLHQIKYPERTGIPPIDKGMLMFYNIGNIQNPASENSIYNDNDARKYVESVRNYPLKLDLALPIFSWSLHFRNNQLFAINNRCYKEDFEQSSFFKKLRPDLFEADSSAIFRSDYYLKGDLVKIEEINPTACLSAARKIAAYLPDDERNIVFFELDSVHLSKYGKEDFDKIMMAMGN